jgi:hypothetical protein
VIGGWSYVRRAPARLLPGSRRKVQPIAADPDLRLETLVVALVDRRCPDLEVLVMNHRSDPEASREFDRVAGSTQDGRFRFLTTENEGPNAPATSR